ncbi:hypothetical protein [Klebsiella pneumoniae]|uniref:hypothetical protein n=1 Tax=Klebsiella pneumoniae TaxID=573 RepID=UPI003A5CAD8A
MPQGACHARNKAIEASDGYCVTGLDDDDEFTSFSRLEVFVKSKYLSTYPYLSTGQLVDDGNKRTKSVLYLTKKLFTGIVFPERHWNQVFAEKKHIQEVGGFDENFPLGKTMNYVFVNKTCWFWLQASLPYIY